MEMDEADRGAFIEKKRQEYREVIDIYRLASELIIDGIIPANKLRDEVINRFKSYESKNVIFSERKHAVTPV